MGRPAANPLTEEMAKEAYRMHGNVSTAANKLHVGVNRLYKMLIKTGDIKPAKSGKAKQDYADASRRSYKEIDKLLKLKAGNKVLTPKGPRIIVAVYPYHVAVRTRYGHTECFTKGNLLVCATNKAEGREYREREEKDE